MSIEEQMLISAVRYSIGRQSYIVGVTCDFVTSILPKLSKNCIEILIRDIEDDFQFYHNLGVKMGMDCDEKDWYRLLERLKEVE